MNRFIDTLSDTVLSKKIEGCTIEELQTLSEKFPYASALQLLYARKLKTLNSELYAAQLQKTLLHYNNPLFINHLIHNDEAPRAFNKQLKTDSDSIISEQNKQPQVADEPADLNITNPAGNSIIIEQALRNADQASHTDVESDNNNTQEKEEVNATSATEEDAEHAPPLPEFKIETIDPAKAALPFTPYFTIDYFAAQGIKLSEQKTNDRFGTQLKSFTAWLKQMKRLPAANEPNSFSDREEKTIEIMAAQSLTEQNADTETMAEVWTSQGNKKKAIDIYKKLSLQIPDKSAYFAAKIENLKK